MTIDTSDKIILPDSPEAATYRTDVRGWVSRDGLFFGDGNLGEQAARYRGATHTACSQCGAAAPKGYMRCDACRNLAKIARYEAMPRADWDGEAMIFSDANNQFYADLEEAENALGDGETLADLRLVLCDAVHVRRLDIADVLDGLLSEDGDLPADIRAAIQAAVDAYNAAVSGFVLSWEPGKTALAMTEDGP